MNKQRFIERLNLHLDGELSEEESNELLSVVRENPDYHRIYIQYCQLFNACSQLGSRFSEPQKPAVWRQKVYALGGMAAAFVLVFLAARNLTPLLDGFTGSDAEVVANSGIPSQAIGGEEESEALLVMGSPPLEDAVFLPNNQGLIPANFNPEGFFAGEASHNFGTNDGVEFSHLINAEKSKNSGAWRQRTDFMLEEAGRDSTYLHEAIAMEDDKPRFSISSSSEADFGKDTPDNVRYELNGAAATAKPKN